MSPGSTDTLPDGPGPYQPDTTSAAAQRLQPSILLLDDDQFMLDVLSGLLRSMDYEVAGTSASAEGALALLLEKPHAVDVVVCDLNMPGVDGIEFLQRLGKTPFRGSVILLSGEGLRIMHTVQKLLGNSGPLILGALEKPAGRVDLRALLDCWRPRVTATPPQSNISIDSDEIHIANREQQWLVHYQPKVDLRTGELIGMEALVRWNHPQHGLLYPETFITVAEEFGGMEALTYWVVRAAMEQLGKWQESGFQIQMAVNVSMENLRAPEFAGRISSLVDQFRVAPQDLTFEITESRLMGTASVPLENLVRLRMKRFGLSIDDFGTGHSSLVQLRDVPFTELKIDRDFVHGARHNQIIRPILEGSIGIAKRMRMRSVAEGAETEDDWHLLREIGCDLAQGWFIGLPMAPESVPEWIDQWGTRRSRLVGQ
ncbi:MAG: EAL domain-containing response regulator [Rhizobacter sp.]|nr:EAL domain-containing response regulator [Rhizobacter sp.]